MSSKSNGRATHEPGANAAMTARMPERMTGRAATINEATRQAAIHNILRASREGAAKGQKGHVSAMERANTHAKVQKALEIERMAQRAENHPEAERQTRTRGIRRRASGGRGVNPTRHLARRTSALERREQNRIAALARPKNDFRATARILPNMRNKPETATDKAIREGQARQHTMTPEQHISEAKNQRIVVGQHSGGRKTLTASEQRAYKELKAQRPKLEADVAEHTALERQAHATLANPHASAEDRVNAQLDIPYARSMAHAAQANLNELERLQTQLGVSKAAAKAAREARLAPLRAHLSGLKAASKLGAAGVNDWLSQKYPELGPTLSRTFGEKPMSASVARRIASSYATLQHSFPSAAQHITSLGINRAEGAGARGLIHATPERGIGVSPDIGKRGALKNAPRGSNGKPLSIEAMVRHAFAPAVERDLQALPTDSAGGKAYARYLAGHPHSDFARAFTAMAYGRGSKGSKGESQAPDVRALKRALAAAYPGVNLTQKPVPPQD